MTVRVRVRVRTWVVGSAKYICDTYTISGSTTDGREGHRHTQGSTRGIDTYRKLEHAVAVLNVK